MELKTIKFAISNILTNAEQLQVTGGNSNENMSHIIIVDDTAM